MNRAELAANFAAQRSGRFDDLEAAVSRFSPVDRVATDFYPAFAAAVHASYVLSLGDELAFPALKVAGGFGPVGRLDLVIGDPELAKAAEGFLTPLDMVEAVRVHRGNPSQVVPGINGPYDLVLARMAPGAFLDLYEPLVRLLRTGGTLLLGPWRRPGDCVEFEAPGPDDGEAPPPEREAELLERLADDARFLTHLPDTESPLIAVRRR
jgi:predicted O-methyltransferase YrrM